ncbi:MAG TPA: polyphosphate kinase 1 [Flavitalea sp.]|nr:polyphosphate kinase 1 [Flavitalea sp.]
MNEHLFFSRDISWLYFNERVLLEAADEAVPLLERIRFLSIFSSNLDEFYRVRIPVLLALQKLQLTEKNIGIGENPEVDNYQQANEIIRRQQDLFGKLLTENIIPDLRQSGINLLYNTTIPPGIIQTARDYFFESLAGLIEIAWLSRDRSFFPANNRIYIVVMLEKDRSSDLVILNIPSDTVSRFYSITSDNIQYVLFIDDIVKACLPYIFPRYTINSAYSIKITRDAALDIDDEYEGNIAEKIEKQISKRDMGLATRFLYPPGMPLTLVQSLASRFSLANSGKMQGGAYHNMKDLMSFPVNDSSLLYPNRNPLVFRVRNEAQSLCAEIQDKDVWVHTPYQSYNTVLRFFNEVAIDPEVAEIYTTMYRVAKGSQIAQALITAAGNGKKVTVFIELKARFDEANNLKWAKNLKEAGVRIIYSIPKLKVHAKIALVKKKKGARQVYLGLLATGNLNEGTAKFYTDHILLTAHAGLLRELELVFLFLARRKKPGDNDRISFRHLLVAQFNLQERFLQLIGNEIANAKKGLASGITIKLNNLEERTLISKLYEASTAGVKVSLIVRSVCCLIPGIPGMSENITIKRIVDRYLEHGRIFVFNNNNEHLLFLGSSDWMNRNVYRRIEVCFPVYDQKLKKELMDMVNLQLQDDLSAVWLNDSLQNLPIYNKLNHIRSQEAIYDYCSRNTLAYQDL